MNAVEKVLEYPVNDAVFLVNGVKLALVQSAKERIISENMPIVAFGDSEPSAVHCKKCYEIEIVRNITANEIDFSWRGDFTLTVRKPHNSIEYTRCRCTKIETERREGEPVTEKVIITAGGREVL